MQAIVHDIVHDTFTPFYKLLISKSYCLFVYKVFTVFFMEDPVL